MLPPRAAFAVLLGALVLAGSGRGGPATLVFNGDVRGTLEDRAGIGLAHVNARLGRLRERDPDLVVLSTGNTLGPSITSDVDGGAAVVDLMNLGGYRAMGLGVADLFGGIENLLARVGEAGFPVVSTNVGPAAGADPALHAAWEALPRRVVLDAGEARVLVLSALSPTVVADAPRWPRELEVRGVTEALREARAAGGDADLVVVLGTMTVEEAVLVQRDLPWVDLMLLNRTARDQPLDREALELARKDGRRIMWSTLRGTSLARLRVERADDGVLEVASRAYQVDADDLPGAAEASAVARTVGESQLLHGAVLTTLDEEESADLPRTLLNALRVELRAEVAMIHRGGIVREEVPRELTRQDLREAFPFSDRAALLRVPGATLKKLWAARSAGTDPERHLEFAGLEEISGKLHVNGRPVRSKERYRLATVEFLALGGQGLLPREPEHIQKVRVFELLERHFTRPGSRRRRVRRLEREPIVRARTIVDLARNNYSLGGSIASFQFKVPGELGNFSDIPGLIGRKFQTFRLRLDQELVIDRPRSDLVIDLEANVAEFNTTRTQNRAELEVRYEEKAPGSNRGRWFGKFQLQRPVIQFAIPGRDSPFFGKLVGGMIWRPREDLKLRAGAGALFRFSQPGSPTNPGVNLGLDFRRKVFGNVEFTTELDSFFGPGSDQIRTAELSNELRFRLGGSFSTVLRHYLFLWRDSTVSEAASRSETFFGISFDRAFRKF